MSSHHFVREGQEPDVIIAGTHADAEQLGNILEWSPTVYAFPSAAEWLISLQIKVDYWVLESEEASEIPATDYPTGVIGTNAGTLHEQIAVLLKKTGQPAYLIGCSDEEIPDLFEKIFSDNKTLLIAIGDMFKWIPVTHNSFSKWYPEGAQFKAIGLQEDWLLQGKLNIQWPEITVAQAGIVCFQKKSDGLLGEKLL